MDSGHPLVMIRWQLGYIKLIEMKKKKKSLIFLKEKVVRGVGKEIV